MSDSTARIAVIGAGLMGHGIAQTFLAAGHPVALHDSNQEVLEASRAQIAEIFSLLEQNAELLDNLSLHSSFESAVESADVVVEAGPEKLEIKRRIFNALAEHGKSTAIFATNTSAIPIRDIAEGLPCSERIVGTHYWNPPHLVRLVEVVQSEFTSSEIVAKTIDLLKHAAMKPVHVKRDIPGFIGNRLQHAMKREAIALVAEGICDAETIDLVVKEGFGSRLAVLGPLEQSDLVGLNLTLDIYKTLFPTLDNTSEPPQLLVDKVENGELGMKVGKGFRDWTPESAQKVRDDLRDFLVASAKAQLVDKN